VNARGILTVVLLAVAAAGSWYLARSDQDTDAEVIATERAQRGFYLKSARILGTGPDGSRLYEIRAERAEEKLDGRIEFEDVRFDYSPDAAVPWTVNADNAIILPNEQRVQLSGHVRAVSPQGFAEEDTEIRTQYLELDPYTYIAETDERVQIRIGARSLTATGMLASLDEYRLELKSNVSGKFVP
jgi:LPS export ABC transporter protein LptC